MLSRRRVSLAKLKVGNSEKLPNKIKLGNCCVFCTDQKNLHNKSIKVWLTLFKAQGQFLRTVKIVKQVNNTDLDWI